MTTVPIRPPSADFARRAGDKEPTAEYSHIPNKGRPHHRSGQGPFTPASDCSPALTARFEAAGARCDADAGIVAIDHGAMRFISAVRLLALARWLVTT